MIPRLLIPSAPTFSSIARACLSATALIIVLGFAVAPAAADDPVVAVSGGKVQGKALPDQKGFAFRGVPFAAPPVGALRWREPQPVAAWAGVREAFHSGAPAAQLSAGWNADAAAASSEDCLYLDVWTPALHPKKPKAVMVWIHGGANVAGTGGADPLYNGTALIGHDVILVVIEYRLGIFGFLAHPELSAESPHHVSGNYALLDQISALHWVHDNIRQFGGDPANVTVFGQSAGSMDISALLTSPLARRFFARAICESGAALTPSAQTLSQAENAGVAFAAKLKISGDNALSSLRALSTSDLLKAGRPPAAINVDGYVFPQAPTAAYAHGQEIPVPFLIGSNAIEFPVSGTGEGLKAMLEKTFGSRAPEALRLYGLDTTPARAFAEDPVYGDRSDQIGSDLFRCPSIVEGEWHAANGYPTWQYELARAIPPHKKISHAGDLAYVFGNLYPTGGQPGEFTAVDRRLSETMQRYWTNFAKTGNPNGPGLPEWPAYDAHGRAYMQFTSNGEEHLDHDPRGPFTQLYREQYQSERIESR